IEDAQRMRVASMGSSVDVFAAAEGMEFEVTGKGREKTVAEYSALERRPIAGGRILVVTSHNSDVAAIEQVLPDDGLLITPVRDGRGAMEATATISPDLVIIDAKLADGEGASFIQPLDRK